MATATQEAPAATNGQANGHVCTAREQFILELTDQLQSQLDVVNAAKKALVEPRQKVSKLQKELDEAEEEFDAIVTAIAEAKDGKPIQKKLFGKEAKAAAAANKVAAKTSDQDPGKTAKISVLADHGMSPKKIEILKAHEITTIAELEARMRTDEWWHRKIKGFGEKNVDALSDALFAWRKANPVPEPGEKTGGDPVGNIAAAIESFKLAPGYEVTMPDKLKAAASVKVQPWTNGALWAASAFTLALAGSENEEKILVEVQPDNPNEWFNSRNEAIAACCARMEKAWKDLKTPTGKAVAKRIAETRKLLEEEIAAAAEEAAAKPAAESIANAVNNTPAPVEGVEPVTIPTVEGGIRLGLLVHQNDNGVWSGGFTVDDDEKNVHMATPMPAPMTFGTSDEALRFACQALIRWVDGNEPRTVEARKAATDFLALIGKPEPAPVPF